MTNTKLGRVVLRGLAALCAAGTLSVGLRAQSSTPPPASAPDASTAPSSSAVSAVSKEKVTTLEKYTVSDVPISEQVLPTVRPIDSVYGDDRNILDIPRSVASVNAAWMEDREVKNAMDFGQFSSGVYAAANYGIPGVPQIRGDYGQIYVNGQMIPYSRNSTSLSFNGVEAMDIVEGPGTASYGPQGNGPGGYVNFVMKEPYFDRDHLDISATLGYWTSGHSYSNPEYTIDFGGPISDKLAYRVSYLGRYGDGYYLNSHDQTQDVYTALTYLATKSLKFEFWAEGFATHNNEINGANRVTQQLINNGTYIGGPAGPATSGPFAYYGYDIITTPNPPGGTYGSMGDGSYSIVNPATAYTVKLPAYDALLGPNDTARSKLFEGQLKTTLDLTTDSSVVNLMYYGLEHSNKFETYGYDEYIPRDLILQDRLEYHGLFNTGPVINSVITGLDYRFQYLRAYDDYQTEPFTIYDVYQSQSNIFYPGYYLEGETWGSGLQVPGHPGYSSVEHQDSTIKDPAAFIQDDIKINKWLSMILGFREDYITANTANPPLVEAGYYANSQFVPLATPVFYDRGAAYSESANALAPSYFVSLIIKPTETQSFYATYDRVDAVHGATNFGGVDGGGNGVATASDTGQPSFMPNPGSNHSVKDSISVASTLYEFGYKGSFINNTLFVSAAVFQQIKIEPQVIGLPYKVKDNGLEFSTVYQPTKAFTLNANLTYQDATAFGYATGVGPGEQFGGFFFQETGSYLDAYDTSTPVDGTYGTGNGAVNYVGWNPPTGRMRAPGVPQLLINVFAEYKTKNGWGVGLGPQIIGKQDANDQDTLHIPTEYELDGYILWVPSKRWDVRVNITNITNNRILDPIDVSFAGNDTIFVRKPISASITFRMHL